MNKKPSEEKVWLKYYKEGAYEKANNIPKDKTVWDVLEEKLFEYYDIPALEYFGKVFSKEEFIDMCYTWARTFRAMGVDENEIVPIYGPVLPDICAMALALNIIGACPYFLKLAISEEALREETAECKIAIVFDGMWNNVRKVFQDDKFKKVIVATVPIDMPSPKKEIMTFINKIQAKKNKSQIPNKDKYIWADKAKKIANYYKGNVEVPFVPNRRAFITSSSGTTVGGLVKGIVATNESVISQLYCQAYSEIPYYTGDRVLNNLPFTAATSLNSMFLYPIYKGLTVLIDPRVSSKNYYNQITKLKPNIALTTGSAWECFFNKVSYEIKQGKNFDFSYAKGWSVGGEGIDVKKFDKWNEIMKKANAYNQLFSGYGLSETFSGISVDNVKAKAETPKQIISVGIPEAGATVGIFNEQGEELDYNQRGELWIKTQNVMQEYYKKPSLTANTKIDGWIHTGDLAEIDKNGLIYVWGRLSDTITLNGKKIYFFDIVNIIKENEFIDDAIILSMPTQNKDDNLVVHIVWNQNISQNAKQTYIEQLNKQLKDILPENIMILGYAEHETMLPYSQTTLKKDKNKMANQTSGYFQVIDGNLYNVDFIKQENGKYLPKYTIAYNNKKLKSLIRK